MTFRDLKIGQNFTRKCFPDHIIFVKVSDTEYQWFGQAARRYENDVKIPMKNLDEEVWRWGRFRDEVK